MQTIKNIEDGLSRNERKTASAPVESLSSDNLDASSEMQPKKTSEKCSNLCLPTTTSEDSSIISIIKNIEDGLSDICNERRRYMQTASDAVDSVFNQQTSSNKRSMDELSTRN